MKKNLLKTIIFVGLFSASIVNADGWLRDSKIIAIEEAGTSSTALKIIFDTMPSSGCQFHSAVKIDLNDSQKPLSNFWASLLLTGLLTEKRIDYYIQGCIGGYPNIQQFEIKN